MYNNDYSVLETSTIEAEELGYPKNLKSTRLNSDLRERAARKLSVDRIDASVCFAYDGGYGVLAFISESGEVDLRGDFRDMDIEELDRIEVNTIHDEECDVLEACVEFVGRNRYSYVCIASSKLNNRRGSLQWQVVVFPEEEALV